MVSTMYVAYHGKEQEGASWKKESTIGNCRSFCGGVNMATEKRLIDANALRMQFDDIPPFIGLTGGCVQQYIDKAPTVDAVEVVHGRWDNEKCNHKPHRIKNPEKWVIYKCSVCGYSNGRKQSNYCPNCGAKMDGDGNGDD